MIQAYNHLLTEYSSNFSARTRSVHKPNELKAVYSRILNMNRHSAYYKLDLSSEKQLFTLALKDSSLALADTLKELGHAFERPSVINSAHSSDPESISASLVDAEHTSFREPVSVRVKSLATPQVNTGLRVLSEGEGPTPAAYRFRIQTGEDSYEFSYNVSTSSSNRELMHKLTNFINRSDIHVLAKVEDDADSRTSRIVLTSEETGLPKGQTTAFSIADSASGGGLVPGLVSYFGLDHITQKPTNAKFLLDGREKTSMSNTVVLNRDLSLTFQKKTRREVTVSPETAGEQAIGELANFLKSYNALLNLSRNGLPGNRRSARLQNDLTRILSTDPEELSRSGIRRNEDFTLSIDSQTIKKPETMQHLKTLFEEPDGLFAKLSHKMSDISLNPVDYVDKVIVTYPNTAKPGFTNPYLTSIYSGMMFSSYC
ncbi:MAG: hypothetical protein K2P87_07470 [Lachnospiraceae bacterium]|nr:hypothetical protein [Lachnospiraceae bacterium]